MSKKQQIVRILLLVIFPIVLVIGPVVSTLPCRTSMLCNFPFYITDPYYIELPNPPVICLKNEGCSPTPEPYRGFNKLALAADLIIWSAIPVILWVIVFRRIGKAKE